MNSRTLSQFSCFTEPDESSRNTTSVFEHSTFEVIYIYNTSKFSIYTNEYNITQLQMYIFDNHFTKLYPISGKLEGFIVVVVVVDSSSDLSKIVDNNLSFG